MGRRIDYIDDPNAPKANSVVPSVVAIVRDADIAKLDVHPSMRMRIAHAIDGGPAYIG